MVIQMGIPENHAKHALWKSGNDNADAAVSYYFEHQGDPDFDKPLRVKKAGGAPKQGDAVNQEAV